MEMKNGVMLAAVLVMMVFAIPTSMGCGMEGRWQARQSTLFYNLDATLAFFSNSSYTANVTIGYKLYQCKCDVTESGSYAANPLPPLPPSSVSLGTSSCQASSCCSCPTHTKPYALSFINSCDTIRATLAFGTVELHRIQ